VTFYALRKEDTENAEEYARWALGAAYQPERPGLTRQGC